MLRRQFSSIVTAEVVRGVGAATSGEPAQIALRIVKSGPFKIAKVEKPPAQEDFTHLAPSDSAVAVAVC